MNESLLIEGLSKQRNDTLLNQYATWVDSNIWKIMGQKVKNYTDSVSDIEKELKVRKRDILTQNNKDYHLIAANLLRGLAATSDIHIQGTYSEFQLDKLGLSIEESAIKTLRKQSKGEFKGNTVQELVKYVMKQMLVNMEKSFQKKSKSEQQKIASELLRVIDEMPPDQVGKLKEELGVNTLSQKNVTKALTTGTFGLALSSAISLGGFGGYIFAVQALAAITGVFGITLPFAFYTTMTSWMAALANPFLAIPAAVGFGWWMTKKGNKQIHEALLPQYVAQIVMAVDHKDVVLKTNKIAERL